MIPSIRTFLLINLLLSVTLITSFAVIANLFLEHKEVQAHLDAQLAFKALTLQTLVSGYSQTCNLSQVQQELNTIPQLSNEVYMADNKSSLPVYEQTQFQIWDKYGRLLLHSYNAPKASLLSKTMGFSNKWLEGEPWRVYTTTDAKTGITIVMADQDQLRKEIESRITKNSLIIMLISYPFLGTLIWIVVGRGLDSIKKVAGEVRYRAPTYLHPVDPGSVPSEIKPMVDELNTLFYKLDKAFAREKRFAADAAHELRTPLAALRTQAQVALKASTDEERNSALRKVLTCVDRSAHVVQQLLTLSRMVPEATQSEMVPVNIVKQAADVIAELAPEALQKNTEIELITSPTIASVLGIPTAISILIRNLVDNAIRYTPENSHVFVNIHETPEHVIMQVTDNGPGIPEELRERVFERFFRILGTKSTGSGLGLGIVQQIAELHHAKLTLNKSITGIGLEVTVSFPK